MTELEKRRAELEQRKQEKAKLEGFNYIVFKLMPFL
jgi:hypothetical protein